MSDLKGSNVLVTGGAGFIGSSLVRQLEKLNCHIIVLDNLIAGRKENLEGTKAELIEGDIRNQELLTYILNKNSIEYVFHLAAEPYIPKGYQNPNVMFEVNTLGTMKVLLESKKAGVKRILHYSTSEVYGTAKYLPMDENHPLLPHSIYAVSKLAADRSAFILWKEKGVPVVILRQFNCFGPRECQPYIIPEIISQFIHKGPILTLGNIDARRDFTFVDDASLGAVKLMQVPDIEGTVVNLGRGLNWSVKEIAQNIAEVLSTTNWGIQIDSNRLRPYDVDELLCNNSFFNQLTGGLEFTDFKEGLKKTIEWYRSNGARWSWE